MRVIGKRPYHALLSHAHVNKAQADRLHDFLSRVVDIPVWYDAVNLPPGASFVQGLHESIVEAAAQSSCSRVIPLPAAGSNRSATRR
jgi:hypothetical protein